MTTNRLATDTEPDSFDDADLVGAYKSLFKEILDRRPSGTRRRLAKALGKNPSFVSQISNPVYPIPIPPSHIETLFQICHFSAAEKKQFLLLYERAHPGRRNARDGGVGCRRVTFELPDLGDDRRNASLDQAVRDFVQRVAAVVASDSERK